MTLVSQLPNRSYIGHAGYYENGGYYDSQPGSKYQSYGKAISDSGLLGLNTKPGSSESPSIYNLNTGQTRVLTAYGGRIAYDGTNINGINASGDAVIQQAGISSIYHYSTDQVEIINGPDPGANHMQAINNKGEVVGSTDQVASYYANGTLHLIGHLPGGYGSQATGVNDSGDIIGYGNVSASIDHAFLYHNGQFQDLGTLASDTGSVASSINSAGDVVGGSGDLPFIYHNGAMENLFSMIDPALGWTDGSATAINDNGWIIGSSNRGYFLMIPNPAATPEPGGLLTFGVGTAVLLLAARRRRRENRLR